MNVDDRQQPPTHTLQPTNALAGPSSTPEFPPIYLPPPGPPQLPPFLTSTQDLISRFRLLPAYDKYVRPYAVPVGQQGPIVGTADKGKGKEKELSIPPATTPGAVADAEEDDGKGEKKWKSSYKQLIKGIPGKHSLKKDEYLTTMIQVPPKQKIAITPFDLKTQREAFSVSLEGLKGWNINALVGESPQAREDRKKRKELKKLAKAQTQAPFNAIGTPSALPATPAAISSSTPATAPTRTGTPRPGLVPTRSSAMAQSLQNTNPSQFRGRTPVGIGTPQSMATPVAAIPTPAPMAAFTTARSTPTSTPAPAPVPSHTGPDSGVAKRGIKREREYSVDGAQTNNTNGVGVTMQGQGVNVNGNVPKPSLIVSAKAGNAGVRPRPLKKQRMDLKGQARDLPMQQPTPHA